MSCALSVNFAFPGTCEAQFLSQARSQESQTPRDQTLQIRCLELRTAPQTPNVTKHRPEKAPLEKSTFFQGVCQRPTPHEARTFSQRVIQIPANGSVSHPSFASTLRAQPDISDRALHTTLFSASSWDSLLSPLAGFAVCTAVQKESAPANQLHRLASLGNHPLEKIDFSVSIFAQKVKSN